MKYHYFYRFFTYSVKRRAGRKLLSSGAKPTAFVVVGDPL